MDELFLGLLFHPEREEEYTNLLQQLLKDIWVYSVNSEAFDLILCMTKGIIIKLQMWTIALHNYEDISQKDLKHEKKTELLQKKLEQAFPKLTTEDEKKGAIHFAITVFNYRAKQEGGILHGTVQISETSLRNLHEVSMQLMETTLKFSKKFSDPKKGAQIKAIQTTVAAIINMGNERFLDGIAAIAQNQGKLLGERAGWIRRLVET